MKFYHGFEDNHSVAEIMEMNPSFQSVVDQWHVPYPQQITTRRFLHVQSLILDTVEKLPDNVQHPVVTIQYIILLNVWDHRFSFSVYHHYCKPFLNKQFNRVFTKVFLSGRVCEKKCFVFIQEGEDYSNHRSTIENMRMGFFFFMDELCWNWRKKWKCRCACVILTRGLSTIKQLDEHGSTKKQRSLHWTWRTTIWHNFDRQEADNYRHVLSFERRGMKRFE